LSGGFGAETIKIKDLLKIIGWVVFAAIVFFLLIVIIALSDPSFRALAD
jgi:hypothetical protein